MSGGMTQGEYLDRTEQFVEWLEGKRRQAGYTQEDLARLGGVSYSYYTKFVSIKRLREASGDRSRKVIAPQRPKALIGVLRALSERLGENCVEEGLRVWGHTYPQEGIGVHGPEAKNEAELLLGKLIPDLVALPPDKLRLVAEMVSHIA